MLYQKLMSNVRNLTMIHFKPSLLFLIAVILFMSHSVNVFPRSWQGGYNSADAGLEEREAEEIDVYDLQSLESLRRAVSPRYIRLLDTSRYGQGQSLLQRGILFTYDGRRARNVTIGGDFNNWNPRPMKRNEFGIYYVLIPLREIEEGEIVRTYRYKFHVDGLWTEDPTHPNRREDGMGGFASVYQLDQLEVDRFASVRQLRENRRPGPYDQRLVEFAVHETALRNLLENGRDVRNVSIAGNFNNWNPESDFLERGNDGIYRLRLRLNPGDYHYKLVVDGRWVLDPFNPRTMYHRDMRSRVSTFEVE